MLTGGGGVGTCRACGLLVLTRLRTESDGLSWLLAPEPRICVICCMDRSALHCVAGGRRSSLDGEGPALEPTLSCCLRSHVLHLT